MDLKTITVNKNVFQEETTFVRGGDNKHEDIVTVDKYGSMGCRVFEEGIQI